MLIPARNIPRIPHIPRDRTRATAKWGMLGKGGKISCKRLGFVQRQENHTWLERAVRSAGLRAARAAGVHIEVEGEQSAAGSACAATRAAAASNEPG